MRLIDRYKELKRVKQHMKLPLHSFDISKRYRVWVLGTHCWAIDCTVCGETYWSSTKFRNVNEICDYAKHGCIKEEVNYEITN